MTVAVPRLNLEPLRPAAVAWGEGSAEEDEDASASARPLTARLDTVRFRWTKGRLVGRGHSAAVYEARRDDTGEVLAVKELTANRGSSSSSSGSEARGAWRTREERRAKRAHLTALYHREVTLARDLAHPHIVTFFGSQVLEDEDSTGGDGCIRMRIFMEYCPAGSLRSFIDMVENEKGGPGLPEAQVASFGRQLLLGLAFLHFRGIAHRDLKAANALVALHPTTGSFVLKLADFGTARDLTRPPSLLSARGAGPAGRTTHAIDGSYIPGTPLWSAPEVVRRTMQGYEADDDILLGDAAGTGLAAEGDLWRRADVWSFGCVVVEMASGALPWHPLMFSNPVTVLHHIGASVEPMPIPEQLGSEGREFLALALSRDETTRPTPTDLLRHNFIRVSRDISPRSQRTLTTNFSTDAVQQEPDGAAGRTTPQASHASSPSSANSDEIMDRRSKSKIPPRLNAIAPRRPSTGASLLLGYVRRGQKFRAASAPAQDDQTNAALVDKNPSLYIITSETETFELPNQKEVPRGARHEEAAKVLNVLFRRAQRSSVSSPSEKSKLPAGSTAERLPIDQFQGASTPLFTTPDASPQASRAPSPGRLRSRSDGGVLDKLRGVARKFSRSMSPTLRTVDTPTKPSPMPPLQITTTDWNEAPLSSVKGNANYSPKGQHSPQRHEGNSRTRTRAAGAEDAPRPRSPGAWLRGGGRVSPTSSHASADPSPTSPSMGRPPRAPTTLSPTAAMRAVLQLASAGLYRRISPRVSPAPSVDGSAGENSGSDDEFADASAEDPPLLTTGWGALPPLSPSARRRPTASRVPAETLLSEPNPTAPICASGDDRTTSLLKFASIDVLSKWPRRPGVSRASRRMLRLWLRNARFRLQHELHGREALSDDDYEKDAVRAEANVQTLSTTEGSEDCGAEAYVGGGDGAEAYYEVAWLDAEGEWLGEEGGAHAGALEGCGAGEGRCEQPEEAGEWLDADGAEESWWEEESKATADLNGHEIYEEWAEAQAYVQYATNEAQGDGDGRFWDPAWDTDWYAYQCPAEDNSANRTEVENHAEEEEEEDKKKDEALPAAADIFEEAGGASDAPQRLSAADEVPDDQPRPPQRRRRVRAVAAFAGDTASGELVLCEGAVVEVLDENASGWWQGRALAANLELWPANNANAADGAGIVGSDSGAGSAAAPQLAGWFPCTYVEWLPHDKDGGDGGGSGSEYGGVETAAATATAVSASL